MTASIRNVKTSYVTVKTTSRNQKLSEEEQLNQQEHWKRRNEIRPEDRLKRTKTVSYLTGTLMDQTAIGRACSEQGQEEAIAETASKLADKT